MIARVETPTGRVPNQQASGQGPWVLAELLPPLFLVDGTTPTCLTGETDADRLKAVWGQSVNQTSVSSVTSSQETTT